MDSPQDPHGAGEVGFLKEKMVLNRQAGDVCHYGWAALYQNISGRSEVGVVSDERKEGKDEKGISCKLDEQLLVVFPYGAGICGNDSSCLDLVLVAFRSGKKRLKEVHRVHHFQSHLSKTFYPVSPWLKHLLWGFFAHCIKYTSLSLRIFHGLSLSYISILFSLQLPST